MHMQRGLSLPRLHIAAHSVQLRHCRLLCPASKRDVLVSTSFVLGQSLLAPGALADGSETEVQAAAGAAVQEPPAAAAAAARRRGRPKKRPKKPADRLEPSGPVPKVTLAKGLEVSQVIRGCWQLDGNHRGDPITDRTAGAAAIEDLKRGLAAGITSFDIADNYGPAETLVGRFMRLEVGNQDACQVLTKISFVGRPEQRDLNKDLIEYRVRAACTRLGVDRLPLLQLHWEDFRYLGYLEVAQRLVELQKKGLIGHFGVANFDVPHLVRLAEAGITPVTNQVQYSVMDRRPALFLAPYCAQHNITLLPYGVLAGGFLSDRYLGLAADKTRLDTLSKAKYGTLLKELGGWSWMQELLQVLSSVAEKHRVTVSAVAARWVLQQPQVAAIILGARNALHYRDWMTYHSFTLDEVDMLDIDAAYESAVQPTNDVYAWERGADW